jgi:molybdenum cofactor sulfurtransferase
MSGLKHYNGNKVAVIYQDNNFIDKKTQGPIVNFNLLRADGSYIGFSEVEIV